MARGPQRADNRTSAAETETPLNSLRIVVVGLDRMTAELVTLAYDKHADVAVVGCLPVRTPLDTATAEYHPDLLIAMAESLAGELDELLFEHPRLTVLAVEDRGTASSLIQLRPQRETLGGLAEDTLISAARAAAPAAS